MLAFIGVGVLGALAVQALKNGQPYAPYLWALAAVAPLSGLLHWLESWLAHDMAFRLLAEMRIDAFRKLDALAPAYLVRRRTGDLMSLATHDIELVEYFFAHTVAPAFVAILVPAVVLIVLGSASGWIVLALLPFLLAVGLSPVLMRKRVDRLGSQAREAAGELGAFAVDSVQGLGEIVAFQQERPRGEQLDKLTDHHARLRLPFFSELTWQHSLVEILTGLGGLAVVATGAALAARGTIDPASLPLLALLAMAAFLPVSEIAHVGRQLADTMGATRRVYALANEPIPVRDGKGVPPRASKASWLPISTTCPCSMATIKSASRMVERRWAMTMVARSAFRRSSAPRTAVSLTASRCEVASSRISTGASLRKARAMATRWRWPPDRLVPRSPTAESRPSGRDSTKSASEALATAARRSASLASGRAIRILARSESLNR